MDPEIDEYTSQIDGYMHQKIWVPFLLRDSPKARSTRGKKLVFRARRALTCPKLMDTCTKNLGTISAEGFAEGRQHMGKKTCKQGLEGPVWAHGPWGQGHMEPKGPMHALWSTRAKVHRYSAVPRHGPTPMI